MAKRRPESELPRTVEEFNRWHARQPARWKFIGGVPVMMTPPSMPHTIIKGNVYATLRNKVAGTSYRVLVDGAEIKSQGLSAIPDVLVTCAPLDQTTSTVHEPTLIVEVLSPSTEREDVGRKWQGNCLIPSLRHYLVVSQEQPFVTVHTRVSEFEWAERVYVEGEIVLAEPEVSLSLDEIHEGVSFEENVRDG
jgi:Uma2 family endonuclease